MMCQWVLKRNDLLDSTPF